MVNIALTVNLCSTVTKEARKLIELATFIFLLFRDISYLYTYMINKLNV